MKKKFLLVLPLLVMPFVLLFFWALGGGKGKDESNTKATAASLNVKLPDPHFKKGAEKSKLSLYEEASKDSVMLRDKIKNDPYYVLKEKDLSFDTLKFSKADENESRILDKLNKLKSVINQKPEIPKNKSESFSDVPNPVDFRIHEAKPEPVHDPRMEQISSMLDKVMAIQHPEILQDSMARLKKHNAVPAFQVSLNSLNTDPETFNSDPENQTEELKINRFYDLAEDLSIDKNIDNAIEAEIPETQDTCARFYHKTEIIE